jgi:hypothetical protein
MATSTFSAVGRLTNDLLVRTIFAGTDIDKVKKRLSARKTANKVLKDT